MKFIQLPQDLFDPEEIVHRVPVSLASSPDTSLGTAYVSEDDVIIHISSDRLKELSSLLRMDLITFIFVGLNYKPAYPAEED